MTPPARLQAAIDVLAAWYDGAPIEKALTNWARGARYAGSKDRAAVRDIVFDCLRKRMYFNALSGLPDSARGLVIGHVAHGGGPVCEMFTEGGYGPAPLSAEERALLAAPKPEPVPQEGLECPDWMAPEMARSLGADAAEIVALMHARAPVFLRVNALKSDVAQAQSRLASDKIETRSHPLSPHALEVVSNPRRVASSAAFKEGLIELQDAASQAVVDVLPLPRETGKPLSVLDYCAGGGGKSLALAAKFRGPIVASDIKRDRMKDIPARAARAGADVVNEDQIAWFLAEHRTGHCVPIGSQGAALRRRERGCRHPPRPLSRGRTADCGL